MRNRILPSNGFTLIELIMVIVILAILSAFALPKFAQLSSSAKAATINSIAGSMRSTISIIRSKAFVQGLTIASSNPDAGQSAYIVETEAGRSEVDWRNLCPESEAELADALDMMDHIDFTDNGDLTGVTNNQYTLIGYDQNGTVNPTTECYVRYDSFGDPECTVTVNTDGC
ncbi:pilus assembly FimT family protein [Litoribrevibacter albus]|nr:prepilin-type N-terminal cleavage/methylation domain-containing protein [Litoribrevibacter albus]